MPSPVVTISEAAKHLRIKAKRISNWVENGYVRSIGRKGSHPNSAHLFRLDDVKAVAAKLRGGNYWFKTPEGYVTPTAAGQMMDLCAQHVIRLYRKGELKGKTMPCSIGTRERVFILKAAAEEWYRKKQEERRVYYVTVNDTNPKKKPRERNVTNPLISPYDYEALVARRRLFEERGRRWPRWMRNSI